MKHTLSTTDITILEHIVFVAEKSAKIIQFYFKKGTEQTYITPKKELLVTFNLSEPIGFDYPVNDLKKFLTTNNPTAMETETNIVDVSSMVLHTKEDIEKFQSDIVQELDFTLDDLKTNQRLKKYKHLNIMGENNKCIFRYQNHEKSWWHDDGNREIIEHGKSSRKFRYVIARDKLRLLPNDYKLILRDNSIQFQLKHLNYYFLPEVSWKRQSVKDWTDAISMIKDRHLIKQYRKKGYPKMPPVSTIMNHAKDKDFNKVKSIFKQHIEWFGFIRMDYVQRTLMNNSVAFHIPTSYNVKHISSNLLILEDDVVITYSINKRSHKIGDVETKKGDCILHQIGAKNRNGSASRILTKFFTEHDRVFLSVQSNNTIAKSFYERNDMQLVGKTTFSKGTMPGDVYMHH